MHNYTPVIYDTELLHGLMKTKNIPATSQRVIRPIVPYPACLASFQFAYIYKKLHSVTVAPLSRPFTRTPFGFALKDQFNLDVYNKKLFLYILLEYECMHTHTNVNAYIVWYPFNRSRKNGTISLAILSLLILINYSTKVLGISQWTK